MSQQHVHLRGILKKGRVPEGEERAKLTRPFGISIKARTETQVLASEEGDDNIIAGETVCSEEREGRCLALVIKYLVRSGG